MKITKRMLSIVCALALVFSAATVLTTVSASAETDTAIYKFNALDHNYGYGEWAKEITYTDTGYATIKDSGRFQYQFQSRWDFHSDKTVSAKFNKAIASANADYSGLLAMDITLKGASMLKPEGTVEENNWFQTHIDIYYQYKDPDEVDTDINPSTGKPWNAEGIVDGQFEYVGSSFKLNETTTVKVPVDFYADLIDEFGEVTFIAADAHVMNYSMQGSYAKEGDYKGQPCGIGNCEVEFSPFYIDGTTPPAKGNDIGTGFTFKEDATDPARGAGTFVFDGKEYPQKPLVSADAKRGDGPFGNGNSIDWDNVVTALYGDANDDGKVTVVDLLVVKKKSVGITVSINLTNADVNFDGKCTVMDILMIKKHIVGMKLAPWD